MTSANLLRSISRPGQLKHAIITSLTARPENLTGYSSTVQLRLLGGDGGSTLERYLERSLALSRRRVASRRVASRRVARCDSLEGEQVAVLPLANN